MIYPSADVHPSVDVKQELSGKGYIFGPTREEIPVPRSSWIQVLPNSSPRSCITTSFNSNMLDFSNSKAETRPQQLDHSSQEVKNTIDSLQSSILLKLGFPADFVLFALRCQVQQLTNRFTLQEGQGSDFISTVNIQGNIITSLLSISYKIYNIFLNLKGFCSSTDAGEKGEVG